MNNELEQIVARVPQADFLRGYKGEDPFSEIVTQDNLVFVAQMLRLSMSREIFQLCDLPYPDEFFGSHIPDIYSISDIQHALSMTYVDILIDSGQFYFAFDIELLSEHEFGDSGQIGILNSGKLFDFGLSGLKYPEFKKLFAELEKRLKKIDKGVLHVFMDDTGDIIIRGGLRSEQFTVEDFVAQTFDFIIAYLAVAEVVASVFIKSKPEAFWFQRV